MVADYVAGTISSPSVDNVGGYTRRTICRFCESTNLMEILNFGFVPLAGGFLSREQMLNEKLYPLELYFCQDCSLVQVVDVVPAETLFRNYFYFSSAINTLVSHFSEFSSELVDKYLNKKESFAVEIGSNDGILLKPLQDKSVNCLGVDPAQNVARIAKEKGLNIVNDFFTEKVAYQIMNEYGQADVITSSNSFAHIDGMIDVMRGIKILLKNNGVLIVEVHYLGALIEQLNYDMIYHEHLNYYSVTSLSNFFSRFGMEIFDVKQTSIHAGSIRCYVRNVGQRNEPISDEVKKMFQYEKTKMLNDFSTLSRFANRVKQSKEDLMFVLSEIKKEKKRIVGYGASGRATTLMNYCGINSRYLDFVVDDAPAKQGFFTPGNHLPIVPWSEAERQPPDYVLVFAWSFMSEIMRRRSDYLQGGGRFIVPLPKVDIISNRTHSYGELHSK